MKHVVRHSLNGLSECTPVLTGGRLLTAGHAQAHTAPPARRGDSLPATSSTRLSAPHTPSIQLFPSPTYRGLCHE